MRKNTARHSRRYATHTAYKLVNNRVYCLLLASILPTNMSFDIEIKYTPFPIREQRLSLEFRNLHATERGKVTRGVGHKHPQTTTTASVPCHLSYTHTCVESKVHARTRGQTDTSGKNLKAQSSMISDAAATTVVVAMRT